MSSQTISARSHIGDLAGHASGTILDHLLTISADYYTPTDDTLIPTGKIEPVEGTPFDFRVPTPIGKNIKSIKADPQGYDLNYVLRGEAGELRPAAEVRDPKSGRVMTVRTTEPGLRVKIPFVEQVHKIPVQRQLKEEFGFRTDEPGIRSTFSAADFSASAMLASGMKYGDCKKTWCCADPIIAK